MMQMKNAALTRDPRRYLNTLLLCAIFCIGCIALDSLATLRSISAANSAHAATFVPAKRLTSAFERDVLNARIFFIYYATIQKPGSLESGWKRYHIGEQHLHEMSELVDQHPELAALRTPVTQLQQDVANYSLVLTDTLNMVQSGEHSGPHYDLQIKAWATCGATMVTDAGNLEVLTFKGSEADTNGTSQALVRGETRIKLFLAASCIICILLTLMLRRKYGANSSESSMQSAPMDAPVHP